MARPMKLLPDPYVATLRRVCLAQALVCASALTSTVVLLSHVVTVMNGSHGEVLVRCTGFNRACRQHWRPKDEKPDPSPDARFEARLSD